MNRMKVLAQFLERRFPNSPEYYHDKWRARFARHDEWAYSVYQSRRILQQLDPDSGVVNFHGLRHAFGTMLAASGVHPKTAQQLMRHSDINLTMTRYTHFLRGQERNAVENLPDLDKLPESQGQVMTGTDNGVIDAAGKGFEKSSATYSDSTRTKHSNTLQDSAKQVANTRELKNQLLDAKTPILR